MMLTPLHTYPPRQVHLRRAIARVSSPGKQCQSKEAPSPEEIKQDRKAPLSCWQSAGP